MPATMTRESADIAVRTALRGFAPDSFLVTLPADEPLRPALDLDSIDFLTFVERLAAARARRIEEDDYPRLTTIDSCVDFLTEDVKP
ncbi:phosphopantetheine-binding protein [Nocardia crassostreae]|uniref:phosphopantetheine-binding protein n=1 Tax=Nocardia crassostreae TaxID=53428 RepID=UPI0008347ABE|nr:phosphopantetheine-binding protein [Nocardia crassostreae]